MPNGSAKSVELSTIHITISLAINVALEDQEIGFVSYVEKPTPLINFTAIIEIVRKSEKGIGYVLMKIVKMLIGAEVFTAFKKDVSKSSQEHGTARTAPT